MKERNWLVCLCLLFGFLIEAGLYGQPAYAQSVQKNAQSGSLTKFLQEEKNTEYKEITRELKDSLLMRKEFLSQVKSYGQLESYYQRSIAALVAQYPTRLFLSQFRRVFLAYSGKATFSSLEAHLFPVFPVSFMVQDDDSVRMYRTLVRYRGKGINGLQVRCKLGEAYTKSRPRLAMDLAYQPTVNARALGFEYGQLIEELSENVRPGAKFYYNGMLDWSKHSRKREDQVEHPVELTNFAHILGQGMYVISAYPDFALELKDITKQSAKMTYFLWKSQSDTLREPDFIFQVVIAPQS
jgi:hypothetical protein